MILLATLVLGFVADARTDLRIVRNNNEAAQARSVADAGVTLAILAVFDTAPATQWRGDGRAHNLSYNGGTIRVRIEDEDGKLDVNKASSQALRNLFDILRAEDPATIANAIDQQRRSVAEAAKLGGNLDAVPPPAFLAMEELRGLPGMTSDLYNRLDQFVTMYSGNPGVDSQTAPAEVLKSMPGAQPAQIDAALARRAQAALAADAAVQTGGTASVAPQQALRVFSVVSEGVTANGTRFVRAAVVSLTGVPEAPVHFLAWREGRRDNATQAVTAN
ncbi:MAG TPA: hypothetical protein VGB82_18310 [Alphaproteobacteria bacterium]